MDKASVAVQYVFLFTLVAGVVVLLAAVQATRDERRYESAMLRDARRKPRASCSRASPPSSPALGALAGLLAAAGATVAG